MKINKITKELKVSVAEVSNELLDKVNSPVALAKYIRVYLDNNKAKTAAAKDRSEVSGGGRKPWKQKGTGRARHGSNRSPIWTGGGATFGPYENGSRSISINKKEKTAALITALKNRVDNDSLYLGTGVDYAKQIEALNKKIAAKSICIVIDDEGITYKALRNRVNVVIKSTMDLSTYDLLMCDKLVIDEDTFNKLLEQRNLK
jgi:large subunit ribosomal protein L4